MSSQLTSAQELFERDWVKRFFDSADARDVSAWTSTFFKEDSFFQFSNHPLLTSAAQVQAVFKPVVAMYDVFQHEITRVNFALDAAGPAGGLIFLSGVVTYVLKGDPEARLLKVNAQAVIHKDLGVGAEKMDGMELAADLEPVRQRGEELKAMMMAQ